MKLRRKLRRAWASVWHYEPLCSIRTCPYPTVGLSTFCRAHTDEIMEHRHSQDLLDHLARVGWIIDSGEPRLPMTMPEIDEVRFFRRLPALERWERGQAERLLDQRLERYRL